MKKLVLSTAVSAVTLIAHAAVAQEGGLEEVVVTGSRVVVDGSQAPTPVTVVSSEQLQLASPGIVGEALNQLPVFRGSTRPSTGTVSATGPNSGSFLNLRSLGAQRTLVLLDGRRPTPSALSGAVDTNLLPQELISRVDVVTGGASAAYGSDAISGVVNFVLDTRFEGVKGLIQSGTSTHGDDDSVKASLTAGTSFAEGRGHVVASASYYETDGLQDLNDRSWGAAGWGTLPDPTNPARLLILPNLNSALTSRGGVIVASLDPANRLRGIQFGPGGTPMPFNPGTTRGILNQVGGDGARPRTNISAGVTTASAFTHVEYALTSSLKVFAEGAYATADNEYNQVQQFMIPGLNGVTIFSGNAYLPAAVQSVMTANGIPAFSMGRISFDFGGPAHADAANETVNLVTGFDWDVGNNWSLQGYYEHGENRQRIETRRNVIHERLYAAADAVVDPSNNSIVCRVTLTNPGLYPGCVPINLFGEGSPSQAALDYVLGTARYQTKLKQDVASVSMRGEPFDTWAGPVGVAFGLEYRREQADQASDPLSQQFNTAVGIRGFPAVLRASPGGYSLTNAQPVGGSYDINEGFIELLAPLARDLPGARSLDLNAAVRYTDYSTSGGVTTWKIGTTYQPVEDLRLRATRSRDIRAPNIAELFSGSVQGQGSVIDPQRGNAQTPVIVGSVGNPLLDPEEADTFTAGIVYQPSALQGLSISVDYYDIDLDAVIGSLNAQLTVDECFAGSALACANVTRDAGGVITRIVTPQLNLASLKTSGVDFEVGWPLQVAGGQLGLRLIASYLDKYESEVPGAPVIDRAGEVGLSANPRWSGSLSATYQSDRWLLFVQERFIGSGTYDAARIDGVTIDDNDVGAVFYTDATVGYRLGEDRSMQLYLTVNNALDKEPPITPTGTLGTFYPTNPTLYDVIGRYFSAGVKFNF
jgi:outer membrane receptor protein involved in Fe transport